MPPELNLDEEAGKLQQDKQGCPIVSALQALGPSKRWLPLPRARCCRRSRSARSDCRARNSNDHCIGKPSGARGRTRTGTAIRPRDFKSPVSTIPPRGHGAIPMRRLRYGQVMITDRCSSVLPAARVPVTRGSSQQRPAKLPVPLRCAPTPSA